MITGEQLRILRQLHNIKQEGMAHLLGIKQQRISVLEKCEKLSKEKTEKVLSVLNLSMSEAQSMLNVLPPPASNFRNPQKVNKTSVLLRQILFYYKKAITASFIIVCTNNNNSTTNPYLLY
jgi:transcriptional regulator with XRE-family HTH domain